MRISDLNHGDVFVFKGGCVVFVLNELIVCSSLALCTSLWSSDAVYFSKSREVVRLCSIFDLNETSSDSKMSSALDFIQTNFK